MALHAGTAALAATGASGAGGVWLFSYNKENFAYDAGMRFGRFTMSRGFVNAQVGQYREDIHGLTEQTATRMDAWATITVCFLQVCAALSCAGRIGMHGAAPPGWFCALFSGCIFMSTLFNGISLWLSMHASLRAQCAAASLLTRKVRLPIPSMAQLDQARVFGSAYEKQEWRDIFRVPFMRHTQDAPDTADKKPEGKSKKGKKGKSAEAEGVHDPHAEFASTARDTVPSWIRDEVAVDKGEGKEESAEQHDPNEAPLHFKLLMKAQEEWRDYDIYARITMLYGVMSFMYACCYYGIGTCISELRGFWVMWSMPMIFMTTQALILRLDILRTGTHVLPNAEFLGHAAPYFAVAACSLEYRYYYSERQTAVTWGLVMLCFFAHFVMALRMLDLAYPMASAEEMPEEPGKQWWPASWKIPQGFRKHLWFITPPKKLEPHQHDLVNEMEDLAASRGGMRNRKGGNKSQKSAPAPTPASRYVEEDTSPAQAARNDLPWQVVRLGCITVAFCWGFMMVVTCFEIILGPESLLKPPGEPPWIRDTKFRHWTPAHHHLSNSDEVPDDYRLFSAAKAYYSDDEDTAKDHAHDKHRRLATGNMSAKAAVLGELLKTLPMLTELADKMVDEQYMAAGDRLAVAPPPAFMAAGPKSLDIAWPPLFEPQHVLCGHQAGFPGKVVALSRRGFASLVSVRHDVGRFERAEAEGFALGGVSQHGPLAGAAWSRTGLHLVTAAGKLLECPNHMPTEGVWACQEAALASLPLPAGSQLLAAAFKEAAEAKDASTEPLVALVFKHLPKLALLFSSHGNTWRPAGEVHLPLETDQRIGLNFDGDDLLMSMPSGDVHRRNLHGKASVHTVPALEGRHFHGACVANADQELLRLALRQTDGTGAVRGPELLI